MDSPESPALAFNAGSPYVERTTVFAPPCGGDGEAKTSRLKSCSVEEPAFPARLLLLASLRLMLAEAPARAISIDDDDDDDESESSSSSSEAISRATALPLAFK